MESKREKKSQQNRSLDFRSLEVQLDKDYLVQHQKRGWSLPANAYSECNLNDVVRPFLYSQYTVKVASWSSELAKLINENV